jgi:hypothetical protein
MTYRTVIGAVAAGAMAFVASLAWMSIRDDYRNYLNQGTGQQVVLVSPVEQVSTFGQLLSTVDGETLEGSVQTLFRRVAYVDYFAAVLQYVPEHHPHENGGLLAGALGHILIPRLIYPDKPWLESDSDITMRYTGLIVPSTAQGTSISLGYMAETYVDFGPYGMYVPILLFGLTWGLMYRWFVRKAPQAATGIAFATVLALSASQFEIAQTKLIGGMFSRFLLFAVLVRYVMPAIHRWLSGSRGSSYEGREGLAQMPSTTMA